MAREKINWLSILQGWAMLWVVIGHAPLGNIGEGPAYESLLYRIAYSFHMPLFMMVSGWLFYLTRLKSQELNGGGKWSYSQIIKDKALRLLLPGFVFSFVAYLFKIVFPSAVNRTVSFNIEEILRTLLYPVENPFQEIWFIITLFFFFLLTPFWKFVLDRKWLMCCFLLVFTTLFFYHPQTEFLCIGRICSHGIWFYLGLAISKEDLVDKVISKNSWAFLVLGLAVYISGYVTCDFLKIVGGIVFSIAFALIADIHFSKLFSSFRNYTYQIFLMGIFAQVFVKIIYRSLSLPYIVSYVLCILAGLYIPVLVSVVSKKINWKPLLICMGLK